MGYEVMTAFFLEAGFLGIMLFGRRLVGPRRISSRRCWWRPAHWVRPSGSCRPPAGCRRRPATQRTTRAVRRRTGSRSSSTRPSRIASCMVLAAYLTTSLVVGAVGALHLLRRRETATVRTMFSMAMDGGAGRAAAIAGGDQHGSTRSPTSPQRSPRSKAISIETRAPLILFDFPTWRKTVRAAVEVPLLGSADPHAFLDGRAGLRICPERDRRRRSSSGLSHHGRTGSGKWRDWAWSLFARWRGKLYHCSRLFTSAYWPWDQRIYRRSRWLDDDRSRTPALRGLRPAAHARRGASPIAAPAVGASLGFAIV